MKNDLKMPICYNGVNDAYMGESYSSIKLKGRKVNEANEVNI
jgi:hypothetical protein